MGKSSLLWKLFGEQPLGEYLNLAPWHLAGVSIALALLSAMGANVVLEMCVKLYTVRGKHSYWLSVPGFLVSLIAIGVLLGSYGLAATAPRLVDLATAGAGNSNRSNDLGRIILAPVFTRSAEIDPDEAIQKSLLLDSIRAMTTLSLHRDYLAYISAVSGSLASESRGNTGSEAANTSYGASRADRLSPDDSTYSGDAPDSAASPAGGDSEVSDSKGGDSEGSDFEASSAANDNPAENPPGEPGDVQPQQNQGDAPALYRLSGPSTLERLALNWLTDPGMPGAQPAGSDSASGEAGENQDYLPELLVKLVDEIGADVALRRSDWERVAGLRFSVGTLSPWLIAQLRYSAILFLVMCLLCVGGYFYLTARFSRWLTRDITRE